MLLRSTSNKLILTLFSNTSHTPSGIRFLTSTHQICSKASKTRILKSGKHNSPVNQVPRSLHPTESKVISKLKESTSSLPPVVEEVSNKVEKIEKVKEIKIEDATTSTTASTIASTPEPILSPLSPSLPPASTASTSSDPPALSLLEFSDIPQEIPSIDDRMREENRSRYPNHEEFEETIYTSNPPFNVALMLSAAFVFSVFALNAADTVRVSLSSYNPETGENELASRWKRWSLGGLFLGVGIAAASWAALAPARIVTRLTLRRPLNSPVNTFSYPMDSLISIHTPITKFPMLSPRVVQLSTVHLLGPISDSPKPYHPKDYVSPPSPPKTGPISSRLAWLKKNLIAEPTSKRNKVRTPWGTRKTSHSPIIIKGDRASYSLAVRRGTSGQMDDPSGAWCTDWDVLERSLLKVEEE